MPYVLDLIRIKQGKRYKNRVEGVRSWGQEHAGCIIFSFHDIFLC